MDESRKSIAANEESISMYLSFDATDPSKWQSIANQTINSFEVVDHDKTIKDKPKTALTMINCNDVEQGSPLRPFDKSLLNALSSTSTPSKYCALKEDTLRKSVSTKPLENKENIEWGWGADESTSSSIDATGSTVKANTLAHDDDLAEPVVALSQDIVEVRKDVVVGNVLDDIVEASNEEIQLESENMANDPTLPVSVPKVQAVSKAETLMVSRSALVLCDQQPIAQAPSKLPEIAVSTADDQIPAAVSAAVDEVTELIAKALKISAEQVNPPNGNKKTTRALPRPRRSFLPTTTSETRTYSFKQRMSVVVKTTLNSPARKISTTSNVRRSYLPTSKLGACSNIYNTRRSVMAKPTTSSISTNTSSSSSPAVKVSNVKPKFDTNVKFNCDSCGATFRMKSMLDAHARKHATTETALPPPPPPPKTMKKAKNINVLSGNAASNFMQKNRCKYCDKNFAIERALHIHLMQHCEKIPPNEKRKLQFTELNHEKKAQLPKVSGLTVPSIDQPRCNAIQKDGTHKQDNASSGLMPPPSIKKVAKKVPHSGIFRTPTKTVPCHICKQSFKSILEYTDHCLTKHSSHSKNKV